MPVLNQRSLKTMSDERLLTLHKNGRDEAGNMLLHRYTSYIYSVARELTPDRELVQDLVGVASLSIWTGFSNVHTTSSLTGWMKRVTVNCFINLQRQRRRMPITTCVEDMENYWRQALGDTHLSSKYISPEHHMQSQERLGLMCGAIQKLPDAQQQVARLYFVHEFTYDEIAHHLNCAVGTVKSRMNRARTTLKERLTPLLFT